MEEKAFNILCSYCIMIKQFKIFFIVFKVCCIFYMALINPEIKHFLIFKVLSELASELYTSMIR